MVLRFWVKTQLSSNLICSAMPGCLWASLVAQMVKNLLAMQETPVWFLDREDPLEKGAATHSSILGFPGGSDGKESNCNVGDLGLIPGLERSPREGKGYPLQYYCLENPHGQRSLAGYSPWDRKESDTTEWLDTAHTCMPGHLYICDSWTGILGTKFVRKGVIN